ncbi:MAG: hypothetical protein AAFX87_25290 [Bacteroidota bacterium]
MPRKSALNEDRFKNLDKFLRLNKKVDFITINLLSSKALEGLNWKGILKQDQPEVLKQVKAYQRLARLLAEDNTRIIKQLLERNLHSGVQIASIPRQQFMKEFSKVFKDEELMTTFYKRAVATRSKVLLKYMNIVQSGQAHNKSVKAIS